MTNFVGALRNVGIGRETTPGTLVSPSYWIPILSGSVKPIVEYAEDDSNFGRMESPVGDEVVSEDTMAKFEANVRSDWIGMIFASILNTPTSAAAAGETIVYEHTYAFSNATAHPTLTCTLKDTQATESAGYCMVSALNLSCEAKGLLKATVEIVGKALVSDSETVTYDTDYRFKGTQCTIKFGAAISDLAGASAIPFHSFSIDFIPEILAHHAFNSVTLAKTLMQKLSVEGELELLMDNNTYRDYFTDGTVKAVEIRFLHTTGIGNAEFPELKIQLAEVSFTGWEPSEGIREAVMEKLKFKAHYDPTESTPQMLNVFITNKEASY